jgi:NAD(P)H-hydrate repair Nnr-like enzyme with NAD(P)H-hydrate dehydratase domain
MAAFINGAAGNRARERRGYGMTARDIVDEIPDVLQSHTDTG